MKDGGYMKTKFNEIVDVKSIGEDTNPINQNELYLKATEENLNPAIEDRETVLLLAIDEQRDFMEKGNLPVAGSHADMERALNWIYGNMEKITRITCSIDTHQPFQIFFPYWWIDKKGNHPAPFTAITKKDVEDGKWIPVIMPKESLDYVTALENGGKKTLLVWSPHCLEGTKGHALENQFTNMLYFHSIARKSIARHIVKGFHVSSEMYGIFKPEYDPKNIISIDILNLIQKYDKIIVLGQASNYCVFESVLQMIDYYKDDEILKKIYIMTDCMSLIGSGNTKDLYKNIPGAKRINFMNTTSFKL
jgi:nicotinamidase-related amidase